MRFSFCSVPVLKQTLLGPIAVILSLFVVGCAGYRVGPTKDFPAGTRSIDVRMFENLTMQPGLSEALANALRKQIQSDGTYRLETQGTGHVELSGKIIRFDRASFTFDPDDTLTTRDSELRVLVEVTARQSGTGTVLLDKKVRGRTRIRIGNDITSSERQALPLLAEDLARNIVDLLADGDWE